MNTVHKQDKKEVSKFDIYMDRIADSVSRFEDVYNPAVEHEPVSERIANKVADYAERCTDDIHDLVNEAEEDEDLTDEEYHEIEEYGNLSMRDIERNYESLWVKSTNWEQYYGTSLND